MEENPNALDKQINRKRVVRSIDLLQVNNPWKWISLHFPK
jgi:hypothetical protein